MTAEGRKGLLSDSALKLPHKFQMAVLLPNFDPGHVIIWKFSCNSFLIGLFQYFLYNITIITLFYLIISYISTPDLYLCLCQCCLLVAKPRKHHLLILRGSKSDEKYSFTTLSHEEKQRYYYTPPLLVGHWHQFFLVFPARVKITIYSSQRNQGNFCMKNFYTHLKPSLKQENMQFGITLSLRSRYQYIYIY